MVDTPPAAGIQAHPDYKLGRRRPSNKPALMASSFLTGVTPAHPVAADHLTGGSFGLYGNDRYGVCGPTSVCNLIRLITAALTDNRVTPSDEDCWDLYRRSGNPNFDPANYREQDDNGVDMQTMLEALLSGGVGDGAGGNVKPIAFAKLDTSNDAELDAAVAIFGGVLWGVDLETAQQAQTDANPPRWDYRRSGEWGGHAVLHGAYNDPQGDDDRVITWAVDCHVTPAFRAHQLSEAWLVVWPWNIGSTQFEEGVDRQALRQAFHDMTVKDLVLPDDPPQPPSGGGGTNPFRDAVATHPGLAAKLDRLAARRGLTGPDATEIFAADRLARLYGLVAKPGAASRRSGARKSAAHKTRK